MRKLHRSMGAMITLPPDQMLMAITRLRFSIYQRQMSGSIIEAYEKWLDLAEKIARLKLEALP